MMSAGSATMETLGQAIERLEAFGFTESFLARPGGRLGLRASGERSKLSYAADALMVEEVVRFEGESDPDDQAVLFALSTPDDLRGTFVATYGPQMDAETVAVVERLDLDTEDRSRHR